MILWWRHVKALSVTGDLSEGYLVREFQLVKHCFVEMDDLSLVGNQSNNTSEINIPSSLSFSVISPVIMQLMCITHFFCQSDSFSLRLSCPPEMFQGCAFHWCGLHKQFFTFVSLRLTNVKYYYCILLCVFADIHLDGHKAYYFYTVTVMNATIYYRIILKTPILSMYIFWNSLILTVLLTHPNLEWRFAFPWCGVYMCSFSFIVSLLNSSYFSSRRDGIRWI